MPNSKDWKWANAAPMEEVMPWVKEILRYDPTLILSEECQLFIENRMDDILKHWLGE